MAGPAGVRPEPESLALSLESALDCQPKRLLMPESSSYPSTSPKAMKVEGQLLSLRQKQKQNVLIGNVYIIADRSKCFTDLPDRKIIFIIIAYSLSLTLIKKVRPQSSHPPVLSFGRFPSSTSSCPSTHKFFRAGIEQRDSFCPWSLTKL